MSLPLLITQKLPTMKTKQPVFYEKDAFVYNCQAYARTPRSKITKAYAVNGSKNNGKRRRKRFSNKNKTKQQNTCQSDACQQALNIFSMKKVEKVQKTRKARSQCQNPNRNHDNRRLTSSPSPTMAHCPVRNVTSCSADTAHRPKLRSNSWLSEKTGSDSKIKCSMPEIRSKRQSCPPRLAVNSRQKNDIRIRKVYFSQAHSQLISGVPCAPPVSPVSDMMIAVKIIPSMADCKLAKQHGTLAKQYETLATRAMAKRPSQQTVKTRLRNLETARNKQEERLKEQFEKDERRRVKEEQEFLRQRRRTEIYALNSVMTQLERKKFLKFIQDRETGTQQTISLNV